MLYIMFFNILNVFNNFPLVSMESPNNCHLLKPRVVKEKKINFLFYCPFNRTVSHFQSFKSHVHIIKSLKLYRNQRNTSAFFSRPELLQEFFSQERYLDEVAITHLEVSCVSEEKMGFGPTIRTALFSAGISHSYSSLIISAFRNVTSL